MMSNARTREELHSEVKARLTPGDLATVDQMVAAIDEGMRMSPRNRSVVAFDQTISALLQSLLGGQALPDSELLAPYRSSVTRALRLRVSGEYATIAEVEPFTPSAQGEAVCLRCTAITDAMNYLDLPGGRIVVEMCFCPDCADHLDRAFGPLDWNLRHGSV